MFPIDYPLAILRRIEAKRLKVLDPFCGRGTTIFAARLLGHTGYGVDASPVAVAIARAKIAQCTADDVVALAARLLRLNDNVSVPSGEFWKWAYSPDTLKAVCQLRAGLLHARSEAAAVLRAICLGALHGPRAKSIGQAGYFSNQMPRTFGSKPAYSVKFWRKKRMTPPEVDVMAVIKRRLARLGLETHVPAKGQPAIFRGDARLQSSYRGILGRVDAVITSPPYYGMRTYVSDQWIRNWFVGGLAQVDYSMNDQLCHSSPERFAVSLSQVWNRMGDKLRPSGKMFIRFGAIPSRRCDACEIIFMSLNHSRHQWKVKSIDSAETANSGKRQAEQMGQRAQSSAREEFDFEVVLDN
jgi:hypothetical protein